MRIRVFVLAVSIMTMGFAAKLLMDEVLGVLLFVPGTLLLIVERVRWSK